MLLPMLLWNCSQNAPFREYLAQFGNEADLVVLDGEVFLDGRFQVVDLLIRDDSIAFIGEIDTELITADEVIEATGLSVTPGFIDIHAHGDPLRTPEFDNFIAQGVTTICLGQDGSSPRMEDITAWMDKMDSIRPAVNIAMFTGHGTLRHLSGIGYDPEPPDEQLQIMTSLLEAQLQAGTFGLSSGLEYTPGTSAGPGELAALAEVVGKYSALITSHVRNEDDDQIEDSLRELIAQGQYCKVNISHLKVVYGKGRERARQILELLDSARQQGISITADVYPYTASYTGIGIVFPDWAKPPNDYQHIKRTRRQELLDFISNNLTKQ